MDRNLIKKGSQNFKIIKMKQKKMTQNKKINKLKRKNYFPKFKNNLQRQRFLIKKDV